MYTYLGHTFYVQCTVPVLVPSVMCVSVGVQDEGLGSSVTGDKKGWLQHCLMTV